MANQFPVIYIVIVLYKPTIDQIKNKLELGNSLNLLLIDNTDENTLKLKELLTSYHHIQYISLGRNTGIANAQNVGIKKALLQGASHIIFFDQDSVIDKDYPQRITEEFLRLQKEGINLGILGPQILRSNETEYKSLWHKESIPKNGFIVRDEIISSGSVVSKEFLSKVGGLDNSLFIDYVDFELCWRARASKFIIGQTFNVFITHKVGSKDFNFWKYQSIISAPFRYFYQGRNYIWLCKKSFTPINFKIKKLLHFSFQSLIYPFTQKNGILIIKNLWKGILFGIFNKHKEDIPKFI